MKTLNYQALVYANLIDIASRAIRKSAPRDNVATTLQFHEGALEKHIAERMVQTLNKKGVSAC